MILLLTPSSWCKNSLLYLFSNLSLNSNGYALTPFLIFGFDLFF